MIRFETSRKSKTAGYIRRCFYSSVLLVIFMNPLYGADFGDSKLPVVFRAEDLLWEIKLGTHQYTIPRVDGDRIYLGVNDMYLKHPAVKRDGGGILMCLEKATGEMMWQLPIPKFEQGRKAPYHFNIWRCGVCSTPAVEGKRIYIVGPRGDVLCLDRNGQADGNDGPFLREKEYIKVPETSSYQLTQTDGDIIWQYDMLKELDVYPHDVCGSTPLLHGDYLYACTSNGQDDKHRYIVKPEAPSLIVLHKDTGKLVAVDGELIGKRMFHGHWSSPVAARIDGKDIILFGGGDGVLYAFEPVRSIPTTGKPQMLKKIWQYNCNPKDYRFKNGKEIAGNDHRRKSPDGPSEIISIPVVYKQRVYVCIGQSPIHGQGKGMLSCIDIATGTKVWDSREVGRSLSNVAIHEGLLYISDFNGKLHCFDADNGELFWQQELGAGVWTSSPEVIDGKIYVSTEKNSLWVMKAGREKQILNQCRLTSVGITPIVQNGVFYFPTQKRLFALKLKSETQANLHIK